MMTGDIWSSGVFSFESPLKDLLDGGEYTLEQLLAEDELLQEIRGVHPKLMEFFASEHAVTGLVLYMIQSPHVHVAEAAAVVEAAAAATTATTTTTSAAEQQQQQQEQEQQQNEEEQQQSDTAGTTISLGLPNTLSHALNTSHHQHQHLQQQHLQQQHHLTDKEPGAWLLPERYNNDDTAMMGDEEYHRAALALELQQEQQQQQHLTPEEEYDLYHVRFPYMSCEVICCEINAVVDVLADGNVDPSVYEEEDEEEEGYEYEYDDREDDDHDAAIKREQPVMTTDPGQGDATKATTTTTTDITTSDETASSPETPDSNNDTPLPPPPPPATAATAEQPPAQATTPPATTTTTTPPTTGTTTTTALPPPRPRRRLLDLLFSVLFITKPGDLDDYRAGYLEKIFSVLLRKRPQTLSDYINQGGEYGRDALQQAFVSHLYSHSIMQILQRLLLSTTSNGNNSNSNNNNTNKMNKKKNASQQQQQQPQDADDDDDDDDDLFGESSEDPYGNPDDGKDSAATFKCNWGESTIILDSLLSSLLPLVVNDDAEAAAASAAHQHDEEFEERRLCQSQHAAEVLMAIIQNSPLNSPFMEALLTDPALGRIVKAATTIVRDDNTIISSNSSSSSHVTTTAVVSPSLVWSPHDSLMTCALNVLESLILQLGGYGAAPPPPPPTTDLGEDKPPDYHRSKGARNSGTTLLHTAASGSGAGADPTSTLMEYLPSLLEAMSKLLRHAACDTWTSPMQFQQNHHHHPAPPPLPRKILGTSRLRIVRLLESLVLLGNRQVDDLLCQSNGLKICLELFWEFPWCSTLHQSVANLLVHIFEGANARGQLQEYFVIKCDLLRLLMEAFYESTATTTIHHPNGSSSNTTTDGGGDGTATDAVSSSHVVVNINDEVVPATFASATAASATTAADPEDMIVSDEDIDAAIERQLEAATAAARSGATNSSAASSSLMDKASMEAMDPESRDGSASLVDATPPQSVRLGYMGHVIIICQALVHACTKQGNGAKDSRSVSSESSKRSGLRGAATRNWESKINGDHYPAQTNLLPDKDEDDYGPRSKSSVASAESLQPLVLAQLIDSHPLRNRWSEFVATTLTTETNIQSTPLGGSVVAVSTLESLHSASHRPGRPDDDFLDDETGGPRLPPRGLLANGEVIDMDDNDLDIAASMMAGLSLGRGLTSIQNRVLENGFDSSSLHARESTLGTALHKISSGGTYLFDDPLGDGGFAQFDEDDNSSGTSTVTGTEDEDRVRSSSDDDVPVMDLFAGQFSFDSPAFQMHPTPQVPATVAETTFAADFANFDDAFTANFPAAEEFPALVEEIPKASVDTPILDEVFGGAKDHSDLLEALDTPMKDELLTTTAATVHDTPDPSGGDNDEDSSDEE
jgi:hypothetical protein